MLKRKTPLAARQPMKKRRRKLQSAAQKDSRFRSPEYLAFVRKLPCMFCGQAPSDAHHVIGMWHLSGMGMTAPDSFAMSLCRAHHSATHAEPELQRLQPDWLRWTIRRGLAEFDGPIREQLVHALAFIEEKERVA